MSLFEAFSYFIDQLSNLPPAQLAKVRQTVADLAAKGDAYAIADYLRGLGVKGIPGESDSCPVANLLKQVVPAGYHVTVAEEIEVTDNNGNTVESFETPTAVQEFINDFDSGSFSDLTEQDEEVNEDEDDFDDFEDFDDEDEDEDDYDDDFEDEYDDFEDDEDDLDEDDEDDCDDDTCPHCNKPL